MRLTEEEYQALVAARQKSQATPHPDAGKVEDPGTHQVIARASTLTGPAGMNKTEKRYLDEVLTPKVKTGEIFRVDFETVRRRISIEGARCWYLIDFEVTLTNGAVEYHEVKGPHIHEDSLIKFKAAMQIYRHYRWVMAQDDGEKWVIRLDSRQADRVPGFSVGHG